MANLSEIYVRVGTNYYKIVDLPLLSGDSVKRLALWKYSIIKLDLPSDEITKIKKYDSFCVVPGHLEYKRDIGNAYNLYEPIAFHPVEGPIDFTIKFLTHIFGDQIEIGLDYLKLLYERPAQILPILCLVSNERKTGKTTYLNWLKLTYGHNMTINSNEDFRSRFNADWVCKNIIGVDEVLLDKREDSERIKNLSTTLTYKLEQKGIDKVEVQFFGKFVLCSNNEDTFIKIDNNEIRYWVRKIKPLHSEDTNILEKLKSEISHFLFFLKNRPFHFQKTTRMWFTSEQLWTEALETVKRGNQTTIEKELREFIGEALKEFEVDTICFTINELLEVLKPSIKVSRSAISYVLRKQFGLMPVASPSTYQFYFRTPTPNDGYCIQQETRKGRYYEFKKEMFD